MNYIIAVCDDNEVEAEYASRLVRSWAESSNNTVVIRLFSSAESFLFDYAENKDYDILLLDIEMADMNGIELAKKVRAEKSSVQLVFITGYPDFIAEGYEVEALHYLMKPVSEEKLSAVLTRASKNLSKVERCIVFSVDGESVRIAVSDIIYVEAFAHSCQIVARSHSFEVRLGISSVEELLGVGFVRCHRSYVISIAHINSISRGEVTLDNETRLPLSRGNYEAVNRAFIDFFKGEAE